MAAPAPTFESGPAGTCTEVADEASLRHTLWVLGATAPSVIDAIGGWLTDRALAGWEITVFLPESQKARSLQILGLTVLPLSQMWSAPGAPGRTALAVEGSLLQSDAMIRQHAIGMLADGAEITSWGASMPEEFGAHFLQVQHDPSIAAQAFKRYAADAAEVSIDPVRAERFLCRANPSTGKRLRHLTAADGQVPAAPVWAPFA